MKLNNPWRAKLLTILWWLLGGAYLLLVGGFAYAVTHFVIKYW